MSIATNLDRIIASKDDIKNAIISKGVTVLDSDKIDVYADKIYQIQQGSEYVLSSLTITDDTEWRTQDNVVLSYVKADYSTFKNRIAELEDDIVDLNSQITQKQNKIDELQNKLDFDEDLLDDLRAEISTLEQEKTALESELNELKSKVNSMTDLTVTENGTYTPSFGYKKVTVNVPSDKKPEQSVTITNNGEYTYTETVVTGITVNVDTEKHIVTSKTITENGEYNSSGNEVWNKVTVNVPQTGSDITLTEITITDVGEYTAPEKIAYNKVLVPSETFYKKYVDGEGNTYIINENGEIIVTYTGSTPTPTTDEYYYLRIYIPSDKAYSSISSSFLYESAVTEAYFDGESYGYNESTFIGNWYRLDNKPIEPNTYHTVKLRLVNDDDEKALNSGTYLTLNYGVASSSGYAEVHSIQYAYGTNIIKQIGNYSVSNYVKEVIIPNSVTTIGSYAFDSCSNLSSVTIGSGVTSIYDYAFSDCSSLTNIEIPNSVTSIGNSTFLNCSGLTSVTIGNSVTTIGVWAFKNCTSITSITYNGTKAQFTSITKGTDWKTNVPTSCIVHCTDGDYPISDFS